MKQGERCLDFVSRYGNLVAMLAIITLAAAWLLGVGTSSTAEMLSLETWWGAARRFLRNL